MKYFLPVLCVIAGCAFLAYDWWLVSTGQFYPLAIIGLGAWVAALLMLDARANRHARNRHPALKEE